LSLVLSGEAKLSNKSFYQLLAHVLNSKLSNGQRYFDNKQSALNIK